jgi:hypothetical protein
MDYGGTALIFNFADNLDRAKLLVVFVVHGLALGLLLFMSRRQPKSTLGRMRLIAEKANVWIVLAISLAVVLAVVNILVGRLSGVTTVLMFNAGVVTLYVIEFSILLSNGFFKRLLGDELPPEILLFICFVLMINAGYFTIMFLKDIILSTRIGI